MPEPAIAAHGLRKSYGDLEAVRGIELEVARGEVFAFLGPNGAGKTTSVEILEGYRERDGGEVSVLGADPATAGRSWRARIGIVLQQCRAQPELTVRESIELYAGYYPDPLAVDRTLDLAGLIDSADVRAGHLSGGQQRRLDVALALVGDPDLLFLDEPTTGFDPTARRHAWDVIAGLRELGKTVLLTTHYMDEAQALADRLAIIAEGEIVAEGRPGEIRGSGTTTISLRPPEGVAVTDLPACLAGALPDEHGRLTLETSDPTVALHELTSWALKRGVSLDALEARRPSLEDAYLRLIDGDRAAGERDAREDER